MIKCFFFNAENMFSRSIYFNYTVVSLIVNILLLPCYNHIIIHYKLILQLEDSNQSDSDEEPSPEALARYLAMRRHTVGVGDPRHEVTDDLRIKLPPYYPLMPQTVGLPFLPPSDVSLPEVSFLKICW